MSKDDVTVSRAACVVTSVIFAFGLLQLGFRLKEIQVDGAADFSYASARQSVRRVQVGGRRGRILDRRGTALADNRTSLTIVCLPAAFQLADRSAGLDAQLVFVRIEQLDVFVPIEEAGCSFV